MVLQLDGVLPKIPSQPTIHKPKRKKGLSLVEPFLVAVQAMDAALLLRCGGANLEAEQAPVKLFPGVVKAAHSRVLHAVPHALDQIGDVPAEASLVFHSAAHPLRHLDVGLVIVPDVALLAALLHGLEAAHAAVAFQPDPVLVEVLPGSLQCAG